MSAYNRAGWGEPSDSTDPVLLKASKAPPTIDRTGFPEGIVNVKVNSQLVLEVRFFIDFIDVQKNVKIIRNMYLIFQIFRFQLMQSHHQ